MPAVRVRKSWEELSSILAGSEMILSSLQRYVYTFYVQSCLPIAFPTFNSHFKHPTSFLWATYSAYLLYIYSLALHLFTHCTPPSRLCIIVNSPVQINWGAHNSAHSGNRGKINNIGLSRKHLIEATELSLERLQLPYVDILYAHRPDRNTPIEETVRTFNYLINTGKTFYWGTSEWLASEIEEAWAVADRLGLIGPIVEQPGYSLLRREKVDEEFKYANLYARRGLGLTIFSPLAGGLLTGKYVNGVPADSRLATAKDKYIESVVAGVGNEKWNKEQEAVKGLIKIAERLGTDVATLSLAWVLKNPDVSSAITGASRPEQLYQTVKAVAVKEKLTAEVLEEIEKVVANKPADLPKRFG